MFFGDQQRWWLCITAFYLTQTDCCVSGVRRWPVDLDVSVLDQQLKLFVSRHSAFLSDEVPGESHCKTSDRLPLLQGFLLNYFQIRQLKCEWSNDEASLKWNKAVLECFVCKGKKIFSSLKTHQ